MSSSSSSRSRGPARALSSVVEAALTRLWPMPVAFLLVAVGIGVGMPALDQVVDGAMPASVRSLVFGGSASAARGVLTAIAGAYVTVTSLTFSLTVVTLQLASSQFSPRLLRTFSSDRVVQATLGVFLGVFAYCLVVLRTIREETSARGSAFVPELSVTFAVFVALAGAVTLVLFLAHLTWRIRVEPLVQTVHEEATRTLGRVDPGGQPPPRLLAGGGRTVLAPLTGFVTGLDQEALVQAAREADAVVDVTSSPGAFVLVGHPLTRCVPTAAGHLDDEAAETLADAVRDAVHVGSERTAAQDPTFSLRQLSDIVLRALSPGTNDPTTAIHGLGHVAAVLCEMVVHGLGDVVLSDEDDVARVVVRRPGLADLLDIAVGQPLVYGVQDPLVLRELLVLLARVAWTAQEDPDALDLVRASRDRVMAAATAQHADPRWGPLLRRAAAEVDLAAQGRWG